jgi:ABC-type phosphate transport system permease subunit
MMRRSSDDRAFRNGTGVFAGLVLLAVVGIGYELTRQSLLSIKKFGLAFWTTSTWNPVSGSGARSIRRSSHC